MRELRAILLGAIAVFAGFGASHYLDRPVQAQGNVPGQFAYISTATTTTVSAQSGYLVSLTINGGTAGVVTLFDIGSGGCTGTPGSGKFATIETIGTTSPVTLSYNLRVKNGICVVTAANTDLTVSFN